MRRVFPRYLTVPILLAVLTTACSNDLETTVTEPTDTTTHTEVFTGTISRNGAASHKFTTTRSGTVTATLISLSPDSTISIGLSLGTWSSEACYLPPGTARDNTVVGTAVVSTVSAAGTLCVRVYDASASIVEPTSYEVKVVHP